MTQLCLKRNIYIGTNSSYIGTKCSDRSMILTNKENEILLKLFKDFSENYNANSISKKIKISSRGALKVLKSLEKKGLVKSRKMGKAVFYKANVSDEYTSKIIETLLIAESREKAGRWLEEFKGVFKDTDIVIIFGSILRNPKEAQDIDVLFVIQKGKYKDITKFIEAKNKVLFKKIHDIPQTIEDLRENMKKNKAIIEALKTGYVLYGFEKLVEAVKDVTSF